MATGGWWDHRDWHDSGSSWGPTPASSFEELNAPASSFEEQNDLCQRMFLVENQMNSLADQETVDLMQVEVQSLRNDAAAAASAAAEAQAAAPASAAAAAQAAAQVKELQSEVQKLQSEVEELKNNAVPQAAAGAEAAAAAAAEAAAAQAPSAAQAPAEQAPPPLPQQPPQQPEGQEPLWQQPPPPPPPPQVPPTMHQLQLATVPRPSSVFVQPQQRVPCIRCRDPTSEDLHKTPGIDSWAVVWKWGGAADYMQQCFANSVRIMDDTSDASSVDVILQAMRDSQLFATCPGEFMSRMFLEMKAGVTAGRLVCGWHKTPAFITVVLQCPVCKWTAGAEIYTKEQANTGVTRQDYHKVQQVLAAMLGVVEIGPNQGV